MAEFVRDRTDESIRAWAYRRRDLWELPDGVSVSANYLGKRPKSGRLRKDWNEIEAAGQVRWVVRVAPRGEVLGTGPTIAKALAESGHLSASEARLHDVSAAPSSTRSRPSAKSTSSSKAVEELRRRAAEFRKQADTLNRQAEAPDTAADAFEAP